MKSQQTMKDQKMIDIYNEFINSNRTLEEYTGISSDEINNIKENISKSDAFDAFDVSSCMKILTGGYNKLTPDEETKEKYTIILILRFLECIKDNNSNLEIKNAEQFFKSLSKYTFISIGSVISEYCSYHDIPVSYVINSTYGKNTEEIINYLFYNKEESKSNDYLFNDLKPFYDEICIMSKDIYEE